MRKRFRFLTTALADLRVGAIMRSSKYVVADVLRGLGEGTLRTVVEYGPGDGVMTRALLRRLSPDGRLFAIELNEDFATALGAISDPRLEVVRGRAQDALWSLADRNLPPADAIVSSIPFSMLSGEERYAVVKNAFDALAPGGRLIIFHQYSRLMRKPLEAFFKTVTVTFELRNVLPCFILCAQKPLA